MERQNSIQEQATQLTRVLELIARNKQVLDVFKTQSPEDELSIRQYQELHQTYLSELDRLMQPFGISVNYNATA